MLGASVAGSSYLTSAKSPSPGNVAVAASTVPIGAPPSVLRPLGGRDTAVTRGQEGGGAVGGGDVEAERAARAAAEDGVAALDERLELTGGLLDGRHARAERLWTVDSTWSQFAPVTVLSAVTWILLVLGSTAQAVPGMVASVFRVCAAACEFGHAVLDLADDRAGLLGPDDDVVVVAHDVDDELLLVGVVVRAGKRFTELRGQLRGQIRRLRGLDRLRGRGGPAVASVWDAMALGRISAAAPSAATLPAAITALRFGIRL